MMARFNEILVGRYNRFLQKLLGMKGGPPAPQLASEVGPTISLFSGVENRYLESWSHFGAFTDPGVPVAGQRAAIRIRNPSGSNVVAVLEKVVITEITQTDEVFVFYDGIATAMPTENTTTSPRSLEPRTRSTGSTCITTGSVNFGALGTAFLAANILVNTDYDLIWFENQEIALPPGSQLTVAASSFVVRLAVSFMWRERTMEESELN